MNVVGNVVRKSIQTNLSLILNSLLFKNISDNPKRLSMPGIYSQLHNMLVGTISLSAGKDTKECNCKCNGHRERKPRYVAYMCFRQPDRYISAQLSWLCAQCY